MIQKIRATLFRKKNDIKLSFDKYCFFCIEKDIVEYFIENPPILDNFSIIRDCRLIRGFLFLDSYLSVNDRPFEQQRMICIATINNDGIIKHYFLDKILPNWREKAKYDEANHTCKKEDT